MHLYMHSQNVLFIFLAFCKIYMHSKIFLHAFILKNKNKPKKNQIMHS